MDGREFRSMEKRYGLIRINGNRSIQEVNVDLQKRIDDFLGAPELDLS